MNIDSPFVDHYMDSVRPTLWPIYLVLVVLIAWLSVVTLETMFDPLNFGAKNDFAQAAQVFMFAVAAVPFVRPALVAAGRCWFGGDSS